jgi:dTDP-glucose 4,6-dehydratase
MAKILVTGGAGFIGTNFVYHWRNTHKDDTIVVLDALTYAGNPANLQLTASNAGIVFVKGDICDQALLDQLFCAHDFTSVVHFAAESHVDRSISEPDAFIRTNVIGTHALLRAAWMAWTGPRAGRRFHHVSTDEVFGSLLPEDVAFHEATPYAPRSPYSASKAASDHLVRAYSHTYGLPVTISNCSNNYGPYQFPEKLIPLMIINALEGKPLPVYGDGLNVRDWLHVEDHCAAIAAIMERGREGETYNVGGENEIPNIELVGQICDAVGTRLAAEAELRSRFPNAPADPRGLITFVKDRPGHDRRYAVDTRKIAAELGFRPRRNFGEGLAATVDWYIANEAWWRSIQSGEYRNWVASHYGWTD